MSLTHRGRLTLQQNAAHARQAKKDKAAARWQQQMAWAKRGAAERVVEIHFELQRLEQFLTDGDRES
jgi:hypothetical protein